MSTAEATNTEVCITIVGGFLLGCGLLGVTVGVVLLGTGEPAGVFGLLGGASSAVTSAFVFGLAQILRRLRRMEGLLEAGLEQAGKR